MQPDHRGDGRARVEENNVRSVGTARRIDQLGRVVVPAELRNIRVEDGRLVLVKIEPECAICGGSDNLQKLHEKQICKDCVGELSPA